MDRLIDLSHTIEDGMPVYPMDAKTTVSQCARLDLDGYNNHYLQTGMHAGTHIDAPMHLTDCKSFIGEAPLAPFMGCGCLIDARNQPVIKLLKGYESKIPTGSIVLLYTGHDRFYGTTSYYENHPVVSLELCELLIRKGISMLGLDCPSPDNFPFPIHKRLLENGIFVLENLTNLDKLLNVKRFEVIAFPLKIKADSSPVRTVAKVLQE